MFSLPGYELRLGSRRDRPLLAQFMRRTYQELGNVQTAAHLDATIEQHFSAETPLWWLYPTLPETNSLAQVQPVGCLWLGNAVDPLSGDRHAYVLLLYIDPNYRRQGLGTALMQQAIAWSQSRGDRQIGLQVFCQNQAAVRLYEKLGFSPQALWMTKVVSDS